MQNACMSVCFLTHSTCKKVWHKSYTLGHCLLSCQRWSAVTIWLSNIRFHLWPIWLQTLVAINSEPRLLLFPSFCAPPSEVAVLFNSNMSRRPVLRQVVNLDLPLCTRFNLEHAVTLLFCSYVIFLLRDCWLIERLSEPMGMALVCNNFSPIP